MSIAPGKGNGGRSHSESCHYVPEMLAVPQEQAGAATAALDELDIQHSSWETGQLLELFEGLDADDFGIIEERLKLLRVVNPHSVAAQLRVAEIHASPIHGVGHLGHFRVMSGDGPYPSQEQVESAEATEDAPVIAVVDSGIVDERYLPSWMHGPSVEAEQRDRERPNEAYRVPASHGTFVTSLVRVHAEEHAVWFARAQPRRMHSDKSAAHMPAPNPTTELDVVAALGRLANRLENAGKTLTALCLSLGAHSDSPDEDDFLMSVKVALKDWSTRFEDTPIYAAGGNAEQVVDDRPVYPGAFEDPNVIAIGATTEAGDQVVWSPAGDQRRGDWRPWIDEVEVGVDRIGLSGNTRAPVVRWSGSSFATALAAAKRI